MNYSNNTRYIITADDRNGIFGYASRYIGLMYDSNGDIEDFAIFYTVDGYLDSHKVYYTEDDAITALDHFKSTYTGKNNRRFNSLMNVRVKKIVAINGS